MRSKNASRTFSRRGSAALKWILILLLDAKIWLTHPAVLDQSSNYNSGRRYVVLSSFEKRLWVCLSLALRGVYDGFFGSAVSFGVKGQERNFISLIDTYLTAGLLLR